MRRRIAAALVSLVGMFAALQPEAAAQTDSGIPSPRRTAIVTRTNEPIVIDGVIDEAAWRAAPIIGDLVQRQPLPGAAPTERTDVRLLRDAEHLYIGIQAFDSEPGRVIGTQMARDGSLGADDRIEVLLDTFRDQRSAFYFATNPSGAFVDGLVFANGSLNTEWDAMWEVRTRRTSEGWTAEFAIPFKSLSFPAGEGVWGFNVSRHIYRKLEDGRWSGARLETQFLQVSEAGEVSGLEGLSQGIGLDLRPFFAGRWVHFGGGLDDDVRRRPGLDLFYNLTPSLKLTATFNTDFGETEVDARQINLTRFSLLFPEKRAFFLEGAGVFSFASIGPQPAPGIPDTGADLYPFFSRRIGLVEGEEVPLEAGVKLTGTVGRTDIGVVAARTGDLLSAGVRLAEDEGFVVARIKRNLLRQSYVGAIVTGGHPGVGRSGETYGADLRLATSRFLGRSRNAVVNAYAVRSVNEGVSDKDWSYGVSAEYPNDRIAAQFVIREIQQNFSPALGFVQRSNVRLFRAGASYNPRPRNFLNLNQIFHDAYYTRFTRLDNGQVESWNLYVTAVDWHFKSGDNVHAVLDFNPTYERLFQPFQIAPGVFLPPGEYRFTRFRSGTIATATKRRLSGSTSLIWGNYWSGRAEQITASVTYKTPPWFTMSVSMNQTFARLPQGRFVARIFSSSVAYAVSPFLAFSNLVQYDNRSRNLGWQSRVRWTLQPGSDIFVAFNQGWVQEQVDDTLRFSVQDTKLSAKVQYSFRF